MLKKILFPLLLTLISLSSFSTPFTLSEQSHISLITCSPGEAIYELFGHTAIRVVDPENQLDIVFNYGLFSFDQPNFATRFVRGKTDYEVGASRFQDFVMSYAMRNSSVTEQKLNFTQAEKEAIWSKLNTDILPENKEYRYNFVFNNCATRPRDIIERASDGKVMYPYNISPITFREAIGQYTPNAEWAKFGFDLCLGMNADQAATEFELHFLPEKLSESLSQTTVKKEDGTKINLTEKAVILIQEDKEAKEEPFCIYSPLAVSWILFFVVFSITIYAYVKKKALYILDGILFFVAGLVGILILFLILFSKHPFTDDNFNIVWLNPFWFVPVLLSFIPIHRKQEIFVAFYIAVSIVLSIFTLSMWAIPQYFNPAFIPLVLLLLTRTASYVFCWGYQKDKTGKYYRHKKRTKK